MSDLEKRFRDNWMEQFEPVFPREKYRFIVAVSGGADSIVLATLLHHLGFQYLIAHCNFHLRGEESNRDEAFVRSFAAATGHLVAVTHFDTVAVAREQGKGIEETARLLRYNWFHELSREKGKETGYALPIMVAQHSDDSIETLLLNICRGTGLPGLHGIRPFANGIVRPLLFAGRRDIRHYALQNRLKWVEDSTNQDNRFTRNFLRLDIIPALEAHFPQLRQTLQDDIRRFTEAGQIFEDTITAYRQKLCTPKDTYDAWDIAQLKSLQPRLTLIWELFKPYGITNAQVPEIIKLLDAASGSRLQTPGFTIVHDREALLVAPVAEKELAAVYEIPEPYPAVFPFNGDKQLQLETMPRTENWQLPKETDTAVVYLDKDLIKGPLQLRHWRSGDSFRPLGMKGKKKLADFFVDRKIPVTEKKHIWLLTQADGTIIWVVNWRLDDRFKIKETTTHLLRIELQKA